MMNSFWQIVLIVFGSIGMLGMFAGGFGALRASFRKGAKEEKQEVMGSSQEIINFWKGQAENLQTILDRKEQDWNEKFQGLTREMGELRGQLNAERAQNDRLEKIFQNRDPETQKFMELVMKAIENQQMANQEFLKTLKEIHELVAQENNREMKVEAKISKQ